jgi:hypothetical protein
MNHEEAGTSEKLDHLFEIGLVLVTVLAAAELEFSGDILANETATLNFIFRITTIPIILLILLWMFKEIYPAKLEPKVPLRRWLKEFSWVFLGNFVALTIFVYLLLSFFASVVENGTLPDLLALGAALLTFPATLEYRRRAHKPEQKLRIRRFYLVTVGEHLVWSSVSYFLVLWLLEAMNAIPL